MGTHLNLILIEPDELRPDGVAVLRGRRAVHVATVHRAKIDESLRVGVIGRRIGSGIVRSVSDQEIALEVTLTDDPPPDAGIDLIIAVPRPKVLRRVLAAIASMGVKRIVFVNAHRVEAAYFDSPLMRPEAIREELILGLEQGRDTVLPEVIIRDRFRPFVEDEVDAMWPGKTTRLLPDPLARQSMRGVNLGSRAVAAIGPEGGWIPFESRFLQDRGFEPVTLGPRALRVETALAFVLGQWTALR